MTQPAMPSPLVSESERCSTPLPERAPASSVVREASKRRMLAWSQGSTLSAASVTSWSASSRGRPSDTRSVSCLSTARSCFGSEDMAAFHSNLYHRGTPMLATATRVYRETRKKHDQLWNTYVMRPLAAVVVAVIHRTGITPNQVTLANLAVFLVAVGLLVALPSWKG